MQAGQKNKETIAMPFLRERPRLAKRPHASRGAGFSLIELLVIIAIILIIAILAIPQVIRERIVANEAAAVSALRTLASADLIYSSAYRSGYAPSLVALGPPAGGRPASAANADLIDAELASGARSGYTFIYAPADTTGTGQFDRFSVNANPISPNVSGQRYFFVDQSNVLRFEVRGPANANSTPIPSK